MKQNEKGFGVKNWLAVLALAGIIVVSLTASAVRGAQTPDYPPQVLVKLARGITIHELRKDNNLPDLRLKRDYPGLGALTGKQYLLLELSGSTGLDIQRVKQHLEELPGVEAASLNVRRRLQEIPNDPLFQKQWGLHNQGQQAYLNAGQVNIDIDAPEAWEQPVYPGEPVVAVIDSGLDLGHPDLLQNTWTNVREIPGNGIDDDGNGYVDDVNGFDFCGDSDGANDPDPTDQTNHGTHVSGIIAASVDNGIGVAGVCPNAKIMVLKIFHSSSENSALEDELEAFEYILTMKRIFKVNIVAVNCSYGSEDYSSLEEDMVNQCNDAGIAVVCAAGNGDDNGDGYDIGLTPFYPASLDVPNVITVTALDAEGALAKWSNYGQTSVDLAAPGEGVMSTFRRGQGSDAKILFNNRDIPAFSLEFGGKTNGVSGLFYDCGKGISINDFPAGVYGNIALIERGDVLFSHKVENAQSAGAIAVVVYNNEAGDFTGTLQEAKQWIPCLAISRDNGLSIRSAGMTPPGTVINRDANYDYLSGTSMAAPHVSGALALVSRQFPGDSMNRLIARVLLAGYPVSPLNSKTRYGTLLKIPHSDIHEPTAVHATLQVNESFFTREYILRVSFQANPLNQGRGIQTYRIYRANGAHIELVAELPANREPEHTYQTLERRFKLGTGTLYMAVAVDGDGNIGRPAFAEAE